MSALSDFGKKSVGYQAAVFVGIGLVLGGLYWYLYYGDLSDELDKEKKAVGTLASAKGKLNKELARRRKLLASNKEKTDELNDVKEALPTSAELPAFFRHLNRQAEVAGVTITKRSLSKETTVNPYVKVPVKIQMTGTFYQMMNYFALLGDEKKTKRIISVQNLSLGSGKRSNDENILQASFSASTFRLIEAQDSTPAKKAEKAPDKKKKNIVTDSKDKVEKANKGREKQLDGTNEESVGGKKEGAK